MLDFWSLTVGNIVAAIRPLPDKQSASDPFLTHLLKDNIGILAPFLVALFNRCLSMGSVPISFKGAYITPLLKRPDLDSADPKSYRPIANLSVQGWHFTRVKLVLPSPWVKPGLNRIIPG